MAFSLVSERNKSSLLNVEYAFRPKIKRNVRNNARIMETLRASVIFILPETVTVQ